MRYLTPDAKDRVLAEWERRQREAPVTDVTEGCLGGHGGVDQPMIEACAVLNALPGVVTLQSCVGHFVVDARDGENYVYPGQVWLWLDAKRAAAAYRGMSTLVAERIFHEQPRILWQPDGQEVLDITWSPGLDPVPQCRGIARWLRNCARR